jgi:hypothetical protein
MQATRAAADCIWQAMHSLNVGESPDTEAFDHDPYRLLSFAAEHLTSVRGDAGRALCTPDSGVFTTDVSATLHNAGALINGACRAWALPQSAQNHVDQALFIIDSAANMLDSGPDENEIANVLAAVSNAPAPVRIQKAPTHQQAFKRDLIWECAQRATSFAHMLFNLTRDDDDINPKLSINDPASRTQRKFACIAAIQHELEAIDGALGYGTEGQTS